MYCFISARVRMLWLKFQNSSFVLNATLHTPHLFRKAIEELILFVFLYRSRISAHNTKIYIIALSIRRILLLREYLYSKVSEHNKSIPNRQKRT